MEFTEQKLNDFLKAIISLNQENNALTNEKEKFKKDEKRILEGKIQRNFLENQNAASDYNDQIHAEYKDYSNRSRNTIQQALSTQEKLVKRLEKCYKQLSLIEESQNSLKHKMEYLELRGTPEETSITLEDLIYDRIRWENWAFEVDKALSSKNKKKSQEVCVAFYSNCNTATNILNEEIKNIKDELNTLNNNLESDLTNHTKKNADNEERIWNEYSDYLSRLLYTVKKTTKNNEDELNSNILDKEKEIERERNYLEKNLLDRFRPDEIEEEFIRILELEPSFMNYESPQSIPKDIHLANVEYLTQSLNLSTRTKEFLESNYPFIFLKDYISLPYAIPFDDTFNLLFKYDDSAQEKAIEDACDLTLRLFMMIPPGKTRFTFIDPIGLGKSFAMFGRLVDIDDRTSEIINGQIWFDPADIQEKLKLLTAHISTVMQRDLQGRYNNIFEYNQAAGQNAEPYQFLILMDYPAGLNQKSLELLEQIVTSGPQCGVFTLLFQNKNQLEKTDKRILPLVENISTSLKSFEYVNKGQAILFSNPRVNQTPFVWSRALKPNEIQQEEIIKRLRKGIKQADRIVIGIDEINGQDIETHSTTQEGIRLPIGIRGANEVQYLTLGVGGSHHALIAGATGSGKSTLLHIIIFQALQQYSPDELVLYLIDFKRGVEFKIYADYQLPSFRVVAIESEREFGFSVLEELEREQRIRADLFKRAHADSTEEYRKFSHKKMPRALVIMDEFHELFSQGNDEIAKKSSQLLERIVRQGRAFGIHLILSSQSYSNVSGLDKAVLDQIAVRMILKCSKADADLLLENGGNEINQISIDDPGRAVYNSEGGNREFNSHFRVGYIDPKNYKELLSKIEKKTAEYINPKQPTRILLSNIEDNSYSFFNQFKNFEPEEYLLQNRLYIGEPLTATANSMPVDLERKEYSNLLMIGQDTEKARNISTFAVLSICINYWIKHQKPPEKPILNIFNFKPLNDSYFSDGLEILQEQLPEYITYIRPGEQEKALKLYSKLDEEIKSSNSLENDQYILVFGYQRAEELKSDAIQAQNEEVDNFFNFYPETTQSSSSLRTLFRNVMKSGAEKGIHTLLWQDSFNALNQDDNEIISYFAQRIAFDMSPDEYSHFIGENNSNLIGESNAIYFNRIRDNQKFRPYRRPDEDWMKDITEVLKHERESSEKELS